MLKPFLLLSAVILIAFTPTPTMGGRPQEASPAPAPPPPATATNPVKPTAESQAKAKDLYQFDCMLCHAESGNGKSDLGKDMGLTVPDFTDPKTLAGQTDGALFDLIRNGKDKMPPEVAGRANDAMVWNLIIYIRNMSKPQRLAPAR
jgi:cytochrome c5